ncbi:MAG: hypothetical protein J6M30_06995 [Bacteroidales bacterium]|nr:hypothetical protein [Bacteroidales bacterium]
MTIKEFYYKKPVKIIRKIFVYGFALFGLGVFGAWAVYELGLTNNGGLVDKNNRYLASVSEDSTSNPADTTYRFRTQNYLKLLCLGKLYPHNAKLIVDGLRNSSDDNQLAQMLRACEMYLQNNEKYQTLLKSGFDVYGNSSTLDNNYNVIQWMNTPEWQALKLSIIKDSAAINKAADITGVEPRMIVGCLVGEQIRLFNSKREMFKKYLGPVKVLSVQSQFSFGVNGIKDFTARMVEEHLKDKNSPFYMGEKYEHILDYEGYVNDSVRIKRLVNYRDHTYSYIYTGCIIHQTRNQWKKAGYDISNRPDILFTLFNVGFASSNPSPNPQCGGSHITVGDRVYTFGVIGFDFYYSGELSDVFPYWKDRFKD